MKKYAVYIPLLTLLLLSALVIFKKDQLLKDIGYDTEGHYNMKAQCAEFNDTYTDEHCDVVFEMKKVIKNRTNF